MENKDNMMDETAKVEGGAEAVSVKTESDAGMKPLDDSFFKGEQRKEPVKRAKLIFVIGIIMTALSAIGIMQAGFGIMNPGASMSLYEQLLTTQGLQQLTEIMKVTLWFSLVVAVVQAFAGVMGIVNSTKPEKAFFVIGLGVLITGLVSINLFIIAPMQTRIITSNLLSDVPGELQMVVDSLKNTGINVATYALAYVLPALYLIGGFLLSKNAGKDSNAL